jgi:hypothetical protein
VYLWLYRRRRYLRRGVRIKNFFSALGCSMAQPALPFSRLPVSRPPQHQTLICGDDRFAEVFNSELRLGPFRACTERSARSMVSTLL